jgi:hypothetical protein
VGIGAGTGRQRSGKYRITPFDVPMQAECMRRVVRGRSKVKAVRFVYSKELGDEHYIQIRRRHLYQLCPHRQ